MRGYILSAGFGTRLKPLSDSLPKALVPLAGKPLVEHAHAFLRDNGIQYIGMNIHYCSEQILRYCSDNLPDLTLFDEQPAIRGTGGALYFARDFLLSEDIAVVMNVDIVCQFDLAAEIRHFKQSAASARLIAFSPPVGKDGTIRYTPDGSYCGTNAVTGRLDTTSLTADFIGVALYRNDFLSIVREDDFSVVPVWDRAREAGLIISVGVVASGYWRDVGTPSSLAQAHFDVLTGLFALEVPPSLKVDRERQICYPLAWKRELGAELHPCSWIEEREAMRAASFENSVVLVGSAITPGKRYRNQILTPWGDIPFAN